MAQEFTPIQEPKKNNTALIIIVVVVLLLLCCCCAFLGIAWNYGDQFLELLDEMGTIVPALAQIM